jgi:hypothetical protein
MSQKERKRNQMKLEIKNSTFLLINCVFGMRDSIRIRKKCVVSF